MSTANAGAPRRPLSRGKKWAIGAAIVVVLLLIIGSCSGDPDDRQGSAADTGTTTQAASPPPTTTEAADPFAEKRAELREAVADEEWDDAISLAAYIGDDKARDRYRRSAARRLVARAAAAGRAGRHSTARRLARRSRSDYGTKASAGSAAVIQRAEAGLAQQRAVRRAAAEAKRVAREQRRAQRAAAKAAADAAEAAEAYDVPEEEYDAPDSGSSSSGGRAGCNPATARDGDGDGIVCE